MIFIWNDKVFDRLLKNSELQLRCKRFSKVVKRIAQDELVELKDADYKKLCENRCTLCLVDKYFEPAESCDDLDSNIGKGIGRIFNTICDIHEGRSREPYSLDSFLLKDATVQNMELKSMKDLVTFMKLIGAFAEEKGVDRDRLVVVAEELVLNAIYHGPRAKDNKEKYDFLSDIRLAEGETIDVRFGSDSDFVGVSVVDKNGSLPASEILQNLLVSFKGKPKETQKGILLSSLLSSLIMFNVEKKKTQVIALFHRKSKYASNVFISVNGV